MTKLDHSRVPVLEALQAFRDRGDIRFGPPGHRQGKGADPRVLDIVGAGVFASDVPSWPGRATTWTSAHQTVAGSQRD